MLRVEYEYELLGATFRASRCYITKAHGTRVERWIILWVSIGCFLIMIVCCNFGCWVDTSTWHKNKMLEGQKLWHGTKFMEEVKHDFHLSHLFGFIFYFSFLFFCTKTTYKLLWTYRSFTKNISQRMLPPCLCFATSILQHDFQLNFIVMSCFVVGDIKSWSTHK